MNKPKQGEYRSAVYTDRPDYADFDAPHKFQAIESIILKRLREHPKAICSYSGGSDSDILLDLIERTMIELAKKLPKRGERTINPYESTWAIENGYI